MNTHIHVLFTQMIQLFAYIEERRTQYPSSPFLVEAKEKLISALQLALKSPEIQRFPEIHHQIKGIVKEYFKPFTPSEPFKEVLIKLKDFNSFLKIKYLKDDEEIKNFSNNLSSFLKKMTNR